MKSMLKRNIMLYFRDKTNMFFSMLSVFIILGLFAMFLGQGNWGSDEIRDSWLMAGVLAVATLTTAKGAFAVMIEDKVNKTGKGFYASPVKRSHITAAYLLSPFFVSVIMTTITAIVFGIYITATGGDMPDAVGLIQLFALVLLASINVTAMTCYMTSLLKTNSMYGTTSTIIGTLSGFLMGIYIPIGQLPSAVQTVIMLFPPAHSAMLFRRVLMVEPLKNAFQYAPPDIVPSEEMIMETLGVVFKIGNMEITPVMSITFLAITAIVFFGLSVINIRKKVK